MFFEAVRAGRDADLNMEEPARRSQDGHQTAQERFWSFLPPTNNNRFVTVMLYVTTFSVTITGVCGVVRSDLRQRRDLLLIRL